MKKTEGRKSGATVPLTYYMITWCYKIMGMKSTVTYFPIVCYLITWLYTFLNKTCCMIIWFFLITSWMTKLGYLITCWQRKCYLILGYYRKPWYYCIFSWEIRQTSWDSDLNSKIVFIFLSVLPYTLENLMIHFVLITKNIERFKISLTPLLLNFLYFSFFLFYFVCFSSNMVRLFFRFGVLVSGWHYTHTEWGGRGRPLSFVIQRYF
jgi:hypothetical protein